MLRFLPSLIPSPIEAYRIKLTTKGDFKLLGTTDRYYQDEISCLSEVGYGTAIIIDELITSIVGQHRTIYLTNSNIFNDLHHGLDSFLWIEQSDLHHDIFKIIEDSDFCYLLIDDIEHVTIVLDELQLAVMRRKTVRDYTTDPIFIEYADPKMTEKLQKVFGRYYKKRKWKVIQK